MPNMVPQTQTALQTILKIEPGISLAQWAYDRVSGNWQSIVAVFFGGGGMSYLASATEWLQPWGPVGYGAIGIMTALVLWIGISFAQNLRANANLRRVEASAIEKWKDIVDVINPMHSEFNKKRIKISDLVHPVTGTISQKRFIDCELIGPAVIAFRNIEASRGSFLGCDLVMLKPVGAHLNNIVILDDIVLVGGAVYNCTIYITPDMVDVFVRMGGSFVSLTGNIELDRIIGNSPPMSQAPNPAAQGS